MARFRFPLSKAQVPSGLWVRAATVLACLVLLGVWAWLEIESHESALAQSEQESLLLSGSLAQNADDTFLMADVALAALERSIDTQARTRRDLGIVSTDMASLVERVPRLQELAYFAEDGQQLASSATFTTTGRNDSRRDYFRHHRQSADRGLWIGPPIKLGSGPNRVMTASHRINKPDGSFGGVVVATINVGYFTNFFATFETGEDLRINLIAFDGTLMARYPRSEKVIGFAYPQTPEFRAMLYGPSEGTRRFSSPIDGVEILGAYHHLSSRPLLITVDARREAVLAPWRRGLFVRVPVVVVLAGLILLVGMLMARAAERRQAERLRLTELASVDALTGLANRRTFDAILSAEWDGRNASDAPLSLILIDIDRFKAFNDTYGHLAGDACLELVAATVRNAAPVSQDHVARYGGEEIAIVLPRTAAAAAVASGERIRAAVEALAVPHNGSPDGLLTVSIGVSSAHGPGSANDPAALVAAADQALYRSKALGRNRVSGPLPPLALIA